MLAVQIEHPVTQALNLFGIWFTNCVANVA